jgi:hypothetical protein
MLQVFLHVSTHNRSVLHGTLPRHLSANPLIHYIQPENRPESHRGLVVCGPSERCSLCCLHQNQLRGVSPRYTKYH